VCAIKNVGLALAKMETAAADFMKRRLLSDASFEFVGSDRPVSSIAVRINIAR
jgi:hypothetical protein